MKIASAGVVDSQSVKTTEQGGPHDYDGAKKINGRKRHILTDTLGILLALHVFAADIQERADAHALVSDAQTVSPRLSHVWADQGYRSEEIGDEIKEDLNVDLEIVGNRKIARIWWPEGKPLPEWFITQSRNSGFQVQPRRWVVERTFGWFGRYRLLSKDYEHHTRNSEGMIRVAMMNNLLNRMDSTT